MDLRTAVPILTVALITSGCAADSGPGQTSGMLIGGVTGGLLGSAIGEGSGRAVATVIGAAAGAMVGSEVGRRIDARDREAAELAAEQSLRDNRPATWDNPETGHRGRFRPLRSHARGNFACRDFEHTMWVSGEPEVVEGTACEAEDGSWQVVG